jgi:hypothetical protein
MIFSPVLWIGIVLRPIWIPIRLSIFDANPDSDLDLTLSFTHFGKSKKDFLTFSTANLYWVVFLVNVVGVLIIDIFYIIFNELFILKISGEKYCTGIVNFFFG